MSDVRWTGKTDSPARHGWIDKRALREENGLRWKCDFRTAQNREPGGKRAELSEVLKELVWSDSR